LGKKKKKGKTMCDASQPESEFGKPERASGFSLKMGKIKERRRSGIGGTKKRDQCLRMSAGQQGRGGWKKGREPQRPTKKKKGSTKGCQGGGGKEEPRIVQRECGDRTRGETCREEETLDKKTRQKRGR